MKNTEPTIKLGKACFDSIEEYVTWYQSDEASHFFSVENLWTRELYNLQGKIQGVDLGKLHDEALRRKDNYLKDLTNAHNYIDRFGTHNNRLKFDLIFENDKFDIIQFGKCLWIVPCEFLNIEYPKDYSAVPVSSIKYQITGEEVSDTSLSVYDSSLKSQQAKIEAVQNSLSDLQSQMKDVEEAKVEGLREIQEQIDKLMEELEAKKSSLLEVLEAKKAEMDEMKTKLENELFVLESEIYSIRCYLGEVVNFIKLKSGTEASRESPIILYQKMRYLDEELGKAASLYDFDFSDIKLFEDFLTHRQDAVEVFCPTEKCITLVRVSNSNVAYGYSNSPWGKMLEEYQVYHGNTIGIIIRNGENLYIGWTDDEKVNFKEDFFYTPGSVISSEDSEMQNTSKEEFVSRYFVFSILQGALDNRKILSLPEGVKVKFTVPSEYIVYSAADRWLSDNRYGTLKDMIDRCKDHIKVDNDVMVLSYISGGGYGEWGTGFRSTRDHNASNRTMDINLRDGQIYKLRLIEDSKYGGKDYFVSVIKDASEYVYSYNDCKKRERPSYALFEIYPDEFIDLTYLNSVWLKYVITTKNLGFRNRLGSYAEVIRYLNKALDYLNTREVEERKLIMNHYPELDEDTEWPVKLSEWKLSKNVRTVTDFQARRFAKHLKDNR